MRYIKFGTYTGAENMQIDSDLLDEAIETQAQEPVFRLYAWKPRCISLGRNQKDEFLQANGVKEDVVRRLTGGRALLHDDEITLCDSFSGCTLKERFVTEIKPEISKGLIKIEELSITFSKEYEVSVEHQRVKPHSPVKRESEERDVYLIDVDIPEKEADVKFEMKILK